MLNKVKIAMAVGIGISVAKLFFPDLPVPEEAQETVVDAIMLVVMAIAFWKTRETKATVSKLRLK